MSYPLTDRQVTTQLLDEAEGVLREMGQDLERLSNPERWDDFDSSVESELDYLRRRLESCNETVYVLARLRDLRVVLDRLLPPSG